MSNAKRSAATPWPWVLPFLLLLAGPVSAANLTIHPTEEAFLAAVGPAGVSRATFDGFPLGTLIVDQVPGVLFSSPNEGLPDYVPIQVIDAPLAASEPYTCAGGFVASGSVRQEVVLDFDPPPSAFGVFLVSQISTVVDVEVRFEFADGTSQTVPFPHPPSQESTDLFFFGATADTPILQVGLISNATSGSSFVQFGSFDDVLYGGGDILPPLCAGQPLEVDGTVVVDGTGTDDRTADTGIASVALEPGSTNLLLDVDPFSPGDPSVTFRVEAADLSLEAQGTVLVTDGAGNSCTLCLNFRNLPPGPTFEEVLCCADGIAFFVSNEELTPSGPAVCSTDPLSDAQPPLPPGYEPSPEDDPFPCSVFTIESPIAGSTEMVLKKDGDFDPRLRLLFSRSEDGGTTFPPFQDITESVEEIDDIIPDPTKIKGRKDWSPVKVACAIQAELCNGIDDDGDGEVDEGLPVDDPTVDQDLDGFFLCAEDAAQADCNDQIDTINPAADEACNFLDDDCDGLIDEGDPGGGAACEVPGQLGACADGLTTCVEGVLDCEQVVFPADEVCDGTDNDCDGQVDEDGLTVATCSLSPSTLNVDSLSTSFQISLTSLVDACDAANPVPLDMSAVTTAWISRAGGVVLPDPFGQACPDPALGSLFEPGIVENVDDRKVTGNDVNLKFNVQSDGECSTLDGSRQELFAVLSDVVDGTIVPVCMTSTIDGVAFECCTEVEIRNTGNR